jgi:hypothetical protein
MLHALALAGLVVQTEDFSTGSRQRRRLSSWSCDSRVIVTGSHCLLLAKMKPGQRMSTMESIYYGFRFISRNSYSLREESAKQTFER